LPSRRKTKAEDMELMTQAQAARYLGVSRAAVSYLVANDVLPSKEILGRKVVFRADVEAYKPKTQEAAKKGRGKK
jgi:excisionase family DNA binding protein